MGRSLYDIPNELLHEVIGQLDDVALGNLSLTCKYFEKWIDPLILSERETLYISAELGCSWENPDMQSVGKLDDWMNTYRTHCSLRRTSGDAGS